MIRLIVKGSPASSLQHEKSANRSFVSSAFMAEAFAIKTALQDAVVHRSRLQINGYLVRF